MISNLKWNYHWYDSIVFDKYPIKEAELSRDIVIGIGHWSDKITFNLDVQMFS